MDSVTCPDEKVIEFIENNLIPLRISFDAQPIAFLITKNLATLLK